MIRCEKIQKFYETGSIKTWVLRDITMDIDQGEFVSIMGPSGSGKSTLLHILGMLDDPSGGEYYFNNQPVHALKEKQRSELHKNTSASYFKAII